MKRPRERIKGGPRKSPKKGAPVRKISAERLSSLSFLTRGRILALVAVLVSAGGAGMYIAQEKNSTLLEYLGFIDVFDIEGIKFYLDNSWDSVFEKGPLTKERLRQILTKDIRQLRDFFDIPQGLTVTLHAKSTSEAYGGDVGLKLGYDLKKWQSERVFQLQEVKPSNLLAITPHLVEDPTMTHELTHIIRMQNLVSHHGFEEGLAEYVENKAQPHSHDKEKMTIAQFLDAFPELQYLPLEDPVFGFREMQGRGESESLWVINLKHEIRRRAWQRFLENPAYPERKDFLRKLQAAQIKEQKQRWTLEEVLRAGTSIDYKFREWFSGEAAFKPAHEGKIARAIFQNGIVKILVIEQKKTPKSAPQDPDCFEMVPFRDPMILYGELKSGEKFELTISAKQDGIIHNLSIVDILGALQMPVDTIEILGLRFQNGENIPIHSAE